MKLIIILIKPEKMAKFVNADRAYIFEYDYELQHPLILMNGAQKKK